MTTPDFPVQKIDAAAGSSAATTENAVEGTPGRSRTPRKARQRSVFLFPAYDFNTALDIARRVEENGGGSLTEETLAINLGLSAKSSGFRLKSLAARQFELITKQGNILTTTPVAKAILKPTSNGDADRGKREAFLSIPLFQAVCERYRGHPLPDSQTLRNVLEREFQVEHSRVQQAERMLLDSARYADLLQHANDGTYLSVSDSMGLPPDRSRVTGSPVIGPAASLNGGHPELPSAYLKQEFPANTLTFTLDELEELSEEEFEQVWRAFGILVRARKRIKTEARVPIDLPAA